jgi:Ni/Co efflux regulator RcnB
MFMKKTILAAIIAATALVPPAALAQDRGGRWSGRGDRSTSQQSQPRQERSWGGQQQQQQAPQARPDRGQWRGDRGNQGAQQQWRGDRGNRGGDWNRGQAQQGQVPQAQPQQQQRQWRGDRGNQGGQQWRGDRGGQGNQQWRGDRRPDGQATQQWRGNQGRYDRDNRDWNRGNRDWNRGDNRGRDWNRGNNGWRGDRGGGWNNSWRNDNRYDWRGYRNSNRNLYRLPRYYAPGGWGYGYRRFGIGFTLNSILYSQQYWINDPYYYRLPEVDGPYRWVRYYNDALLVDIYSGEVVDTIYDIFW